MADTKTEVESAQAFCARIEARQMDLNEFEAAENAPDEWFVEAVRERDAAVRAAAIEEAARVCDAREAVFRGDMADHDEGSFGWKFLATKAFEAEICADDIRALAGKG